VLRFAEMENEGKRPGTVNLLLVGVIVGVGLAVAFAAFVPIVTCPECWPPPAFDKHGTTEIFFPCERCGYRRRVSLLNAWRFPLKGRAP